MGIYHSILFSYYIIFQWHNNKLSLHAQKLQFQAATPYKTKTIY